MPSLTRRRLLQALAATTVGAPVAAYAERRLIDHEYFEINHLEVWLTSLDPAHDGTVVAQLSDLHIGSGVPDGRVIRAVRAVNEAKPDLVVLTGDFVTNRKDPISRVPELLAPLAAPSFAVLGNHDHWSGADAISTGLGRIGVSVLRNQHSLVRHRGVDFAVIGVDDSTTRNDDVDAAFGGTDADTSRLVLTHTPSCARKLPAWQDVLCLSGHTHGGQWNVPAHPGRLQPNWPTVVPRSLRRQGQPTLRQPRARLRPGHSLAAHQFRP